MTGTWVYFSGSAALFFPLITCNTFTVLTFGGNFFCSPRVLLGGLVLVFTWCILPLVYGVELAGLLEDPTFSVGMISGFYQGYYGSGILGPEFC